MEGLPYLEVHHIHSIADDGIDLPINVASLCPNCHREAHFGSSADIIKNRLIQTILEKENQLNLAFL
ncbi:HNH endonuclease [compost metagenome]